MTLTPDINTLVEQSPMHDTFKNRSMPSAGIPSNRLLRTLLAACSKKLRGEACEKSILRLLLRTGSPPGPEIECWRG